MSLQQHMMHDLGASIVLGKIMYYNAFDHIQGCSENFEYRVETDISVRL